MRVSHLGRDDELVELLARQRHADHRAAHLDDLAPPRVRVEVVRELLEEARDVAQRARGALEHLQAIDDTDQVNVQLAMAQAEHTAGPSCAGWME